MSLGKNKLSPLFQMFINSSWSLSSHPSHPSFLLHSLQVSKYSFIQGSDLQGREGGGEGDGWWSKELNTSYFKKVSKRHPKTVFEQERNSVRVCVGGGLNSVKFCLNFYLKVKYKESLIY